MMQLIEGEDYYFEDGLMVFTSQYHLKRGYCCGSGCRHCPYEAAQEIADDNRQIKQEINEPKT